MAKKSGIAAIIALLVVSEAAFASFFGQEMEASFYVPPSPFFGPGGNFSVTQFEVGNLVEVEQFGVFNEATIDVSSSNILLQFIKPESDTGRIFVTLGSFVFIDNGSSIPNIGGVALNPATTDFLTSNGADIAFDPSRISFGDDSIAVDFSGLGVRAGRQLSLDVSFTVVPAPAAVWLFGSALGLLGWVRKKETNRFS